jgi:hypothetical protein
MRLETFVSRVDKVVNPLVQLDDTEVALINWKSNPRSKIPHGSYNILIVYDNLSFILFTLFYKPGQDDGSWHEVPKEKLKWTSMVYTNEINQSRHFALVPMSRLKGKRTKKPVDDNPDFFEGWQFRIAFKKHDEPEYGFFEDPDLVVDENFCTNQYAYTIGAVRNAGASCAIDPETGKQMDVCLNWRRTDSVGSSCREIISSDDENRSITSFCGQLSDAQDCKCVSRAKSDDYKVNKPLNPDHDYCWYPQCSSGAYLLMDKDKEIRCESKNCRVQYVNTDVGGAVDITNNKTALDCFNTTADNPSKKRDRPKKRSSSP